MHTPSPVWAPLLTSLAVELTLVGAVALAIQFALKSALWRRMLGQVTLVSLVLVTFVEASGVGRSAWTWAANRLQGNPTAAADATRRTFTIASLNRPLTSTLRTAATEDGSAATPPLVERLETVAAPVAVRLTPVVVAEHVVWWPGMLWLAGFVLLALRVLLARALFVIFQRGRRGEVLDPALLERVQALTRPMGLHRRVRVTYTSGLAGPIAFGIFRPCVSLPRDFQVRFSSTQQEAMLAHELAHLAAGDPAWHLVADLVAALLWWHPLAWWSRRQLRSACEAAADEASLLVENGPHALAECLVALGGRLARTHSLGGLGIEGDDFRSGLGRRVKRLLDLNGQSWRPWRRSRQWLLTTFCPVILVVLVLAGTSWVQPREAKSETPGQSFEKSVLGLAWSSILQVSLKNSERGAAGSVEPEKIDWQPWSEAAVAQARADGRPVLVHFIADWAVTAQANEKTSLDIPSVREKLRTLGAAALRADCTRPTEVMTAELRTHQRVGVPLTLVYSPDPNVPPQVLPALLTPELVLQALDQTLAIPSRPVDSSKPADTRKNDVPTLILQGKTLLDAGKLAEAETKLKEALRLDPANKAAAHYLALAGTQRAGTTTAKAGGIPLLGELPLLGRLFATNALPNGASNQGVGGTLSGQSSSPRSNPGRDVMQSKLDSIRIGRMFFDNAPLSEVVRQLTEQSRMGDPEKRGVNFIINSPNAPVVGEPTNGSPAAQSSPENPVDTPIRVQKTLSNLTLREALEVVMKCATDRLKYTVEDYGIVISFNSFNSSRPLHTRWFKVDPKTMAGNLRGLMGTNVVFARDGGAPESLRRQVFDATGVDLSPPKSIFFNDRSGVLMVRATLWDLDAIEQFIQALNTDLEAYAGIVPLGELPPPGQLSVRNAPDKDASGPDASVSPPAPESSVLHTRWFTLHPNTLAANLREMMGSNAVPARTFNTPESALTDLRHVLAATGVEMSPPKTMLFNDRLGQLLVRATLSDLEAIERLIQALNTSPPQVVIEVRFCEMTEEDGKSLGFDWLPANASGGSSEGGLAPSPGIASKNNGVSFGVGNGVAPRSPTVTGILTEPQFRVVLRALEQRRGVDLLTVPKVTTLSGRQAQIKTVEVRYIVTDLDFNTNAAPPSGASAESVGIQPIAQPFELGPVIDLVPYVAADGFTIHLTVIASIKEFVGYENKEGFLATLRRGKSEPQTSPTPLPRFRLRQVVTSAVVWDGQTLVLSGGSMAFEEAGEKSAPDVSGQKGATRLVRPNAASRQRKSLLVFVTPTIIDPAGNRVHSPGDLPIRKNSVPPQKAATVK